MDDWELIGQASGPAHVINPMVQDWLCQGLTDLSPSTVANYRHLARHAISKLGAVKLRDLTARHVQVTLADLSGSLSTRSLRLPC
jgi:hypothetical protein